MAKHFFKLVGFKIYNSWLTYHIRVLHNFTTGGWNSENAFNWADSQGKVGGFGWVKERKIRVQVQVKVLTCTCTSVAHARK